LKVKLGHDERQLFLYITLELLHVKHFKKLVKKREEITGILVVTLSDPAPEQVRQFEEHG